MDVVVWLRSLGLGKYEAAFRENEIDETVLPNLTAEDLKELGVAALGHRRKRSLNFWTFNALFNGLTMARSHALRVVSRFRQRRLGDTYKRRPTRLASSF